MQTNSKRSALFALLSIAVIAVVVLSCSEDRVTSSYKTHPTGWMDVHSPEWHGQAAMGSQGQSCAGCHNILPFDPAASERPDPSPIAAQQTGCYECHSYPHQGDFAQGHAAEIRAMEWQTIRDCQACHGVDFAGGRTEASCRTCHTQNSGPASCSTCHGMPPSAQNPLGDRNPGAHYAHTRYSCTECHNRVRGLDHIGPLPADVRFDDARISTTNGYPATYTNQSNCATYCHSNARGGDPLVAVTWGTGQTLNNCRSCHQVPPASPTHPAIPQCHLCHHNVDPNSNYFDANQIIFLPGDTLHVNGVVNIFFQ